MSKFLERLVAIRTGGGTERCHGILHQGSYSNDKHTWGVLVLLYLLWPGDFARLSAIVLFHDVPEAWIGDIPATTKNYVPAVKNAVSVMELKIFRELQIPDDQGMSPDDTAKVKACDRLELYLWGLEQMHGGNLHASCIVRQLDTFFEQKPLPSAADVLYRELRLEGPSAVEHRTDGTIERIAEED